MDADIDKGDYVLVLARVTHVEGGHVLVVPESDGEDDLGMVVQPRDILKNYGKQPCSPCRQAPKHIVAVAPGDSATTIVKLEGREIKDVELVEVEDPYAVAKAVQGLVTVSEHTKVLIDNTGGRGEPILEQIEKMGANGLLAVFKPRPPKLHDLYRCLDLAIRTGELSLAGFYNRFKDGDARALDPGEYLKEYYAENPQPRVAKKPCKNCP